MKGITRLYRRLMLRRLALLVVSSLVMWAGTAWLFWFDSNCIWAAVAAGLGGAGVWIVLRHPYKHVEELRKHRHVDEDVSKE
ncbi:MAG: hypothetical protein GY906_28375 [bacterium]|nr:hypothetical protein [bacterium]